MSKVQDQYAIAGAKLAVKLNTITTYSALPAVALRLGIIAGDNTALSDVVGPFVAAENALVNKNAVTAAMTQTRDTAQEKALIVVRWFAPKWYYNNQAATATDILNADLEPHSDVRTSHQGASIEMPIMEVEPISGHRFQINVRDSLGNKGKPVNIVFIRIRYFVVVTGTTIPVAPEDFYKFTDNSRSAIVLSLPATNAGLQIAISSCYVDAQGVEGPYCAVVTTNIS